MEEWRDGSSLRLDTVSGADRVVVVVRGEVDAATAPQLAAVVEAALADGVTELEFDLAELDFLDSTGIGVIALALRRLAEVQGELVLRHVPDTVKRLLQISDLVRFVRIEE